MAGLSGNYTEYALKKKILFIFIDRREGKEKERERNINVWLLLGCPLLGTWPATQACALTGNGTGDPLVYAITQSTKLHQPGQICFFFDTVKLLLHDEFKFLNIWCRENKITL